MLRAARGLSAGHGVAIDVDVSKHCSEVQPLIKERGLEKSSGRTLCTLASTLPADPSSPLRQEYVSVVYYPVRGILE